MCRSAMLACLYVYLVCTYCPQKSEEGIGDPETEVTNSCAMPLGAED